MKRFFLFAVLALPAATLISANTVKVFILAGQSNMEGKVQSKLMEHQSTDPKTADLFKHLRDEDGWITRDDVSIKFLKKHGGLTQGYGSGDRTGVELEFGWRMGDHFEEPVLLIKTAWGGHSLYKLFRSPSAGLPDALIDADLEKAVKGVENRNKKHNKNDLLPTREEIVEKFGSSYREMMEEVETTLTELGTLFPSLENHQPEIAGFVWFQGWNDQYNKAELEYESNMKHFINDVREDLKSPELPFVIGVMGQNGSKEPKGPMLAIQTAQLAMAEVPEFKDNVRAVRTDVLIDKAAEALYPTWRENFEEWEKTGSDHGYHYLGSAIWHLRMGGAFADAMLELLPE